jgi:hypothetical protein
MWTDQYTMGTEALSQRQNGRGLKLITHVHAVPRTWTSKSISLILFKLHINYVIYGLTLRHHPLFWKNTFGSKIVSRIMFHNADCLRYFSQHKQFHTLHSRHGFLFPCWNTVTDTTEPPFSSIALPPHAAEFNNECRIPRPISVR